MKHFCFYVWLTLLIRSRSSSTSWAPRWVAVSWERCGAGSGLSYTCLNSESLHAAYQDFLLLFVFHYSPLWVCGCPNIRHCKQEALGMPWAHAHRMAGQDTVSALCLLCSYVWTMWFERVSEAAYRDCVLVTGPLLWWNNTTQWPRSLIKKTYHWELAYSFRGSFTAIGAESIHAGRHGAEQ